MQSSGAETEGEKLVKAVRINRVFVVISVKYSFIKECRQQHGDDYFHLHCRC